MPPQQQPPQGMSGSNPFAAPGGAGGGTNPFATGGAGAGGAAVDQEWNRLFAAK
jgi:hypothetical protein